MTRCIGRCGAGTVLDISWPFGPVVFETETRTFCRFGSGLTGGRSFFELGSRKGFGPLLYRPSSSSLFHFPHCLGPVLLVPVFVVRCAFDPGAPVSVRDTTRRVLWTRCPGVRPGRDSQSCTRDSTLTVVSQGIRGWERFGLGN